MPIESLFSFLPFRNALDRPLTLALLGFLLAAPAIAEESARLAAAGPVLWVLDDGQVVASGHAETSRGDAGEHGRRHFEPVAGLQGIVSVAMSADEDGAAAIDGKGHLWLWGYNWCPQVRPEEQCEEMAHVPVLYDGLEDLQQVAVAENHLVALRRDGTVFTLATNDWDSNEYGQLGAGDRESHAEPVEIGIDDGVQVAANEEVTLILRSDGTVWGAGSGRQGLLGRSARQPESRFSFDEDASANPKPIQVHGLAKIRAISLGYHAAVALDDKGRVWGWGNNESGQIGSNVSDVGVHRPALIRGLENITAVSAGYDFTLALRADGKVQALGGNVHGTLGDKRGELEGELRTIRGLESVKAIRAGYYTAFAQLEDGRFVGWGSNSFSPEGELSMLPPTVLDADRKPQPPSAVLAAGGVALRITNELGVDQISERLELRIAGMPPAVFEVDAEISETEVRLELPVGLHSYSIIGSAQQEDGRRKVSGSGLLVVAPQAMEIRLRSLVEAKGPVEAIRQLRGEIEQSDKHRLATLRLEADGPLSAERLASLEADFGYVLPAAYRQALLRIGPFRLGYPDSAFPALALFAPDGERTIDSWIRTGLALEDQETDDSWLQEAISSFEWFREELEGPTRVLRRLWSDRWIGAVGGLGPYVIAGDAERCPDGTPPAEWLYSFFDSTTDDETGMEYHRYLNPEFECDLDLDERIEELLQATLSSAYEESGVVFLFPKPGDEDRYVSFLSVEDDGEVRTIRLNGGSWWE
ncbi:MAG: hypothetical protein MPN21_19045 [Thermoanaerobaculia bacterium]|nr:hypothetical protein [Thermoanaerobaculia bacterium]